MTQEGEERNYGIRNCDDKLSEKNTMKKSNLQVIKEAYNKLKKRKEDIKTRINREQGVTIRQDTRSKQHN